VTLDACVQGPPAPAAAMGDKPYPVTIGSPLKKEGSPMQVTAFSSPASPEWRWRICGYAGEMVEESYSGFPTIAAAMTNGTERLGQINLEQVQDADRSMAARSYRLAARHRRR